METGGAIVAILNRDVFMSMTRDERMALVHSEKCADCGVALQESITGRNQSPTGPVCNVCSFEQFSKEIEEHPLLIGGRRMKHAVSV